MVCVQSDIVFSGIHYCVHALGISCKASYQFLKPYIDCFSFCCHFFLILFKSSESHTLRSWPKAVTVIPLFSIIYTYDLISSS